MNTNQDIGRYGFECPGGVTFWTYNLLVYLSKLYAETSKLLS
jgi:hypothetical protein